MTKTSKAKQSTSETASSFPRAGDRLREVLIEKKLIKKQDLEKALKIQRSEGGSLSQIVVRKGWVEPEALTAALSQVLQIPTVRLFKIELDPELAKLIPPKQAMTYQVVPISRIGDQLTVVMSDPMNILALDHLSRVTKLTLSPFLATEEEIQQALNRLYGGRIHESLDELSAQKAGVSTLELLSREETAVDSEGELLRKTQEGPVVRVTNAILTEGALKKASDILIEPFEKSLRIRYRINGTFREGAIPPAAMHLGIVSRIKVMSNLNIAEHRLPQDGRLNFSVRGKSMDFRVSVIPTYYGEKICLRILDKSQGRLEIDQLEFDSKSIDALEAAAGHSHGMILLTGPTGSGKTTTMYSLLHLVDKPDRNLVTIEDPVEYDLEGINQVAVAPEAGLTFASGLRAILRQDPDVIMIGEIRDKETAEVSIKAALTGHLVFSTLHANDALSTVVRLVNMGVEPYLISASVRLLGAQRLLRKVCLACAQDHPPPRPLIEKLQLPQGKYKKGKGCSACQDTGLAERAGLMEAISLTPQLKHLIEQKASAAQLREAARAAGFRSLRENAIAKAAAGVIPLEEAVRATSGTEA